jgi:hypothetical protein
VKPHPFSCDYLAESAHNDVKCNDNESLANLSGALDPLIRFNKLELL